MTIEPIDVRDLIGHPGVSRLAHVGGTLEGLGTEVARRSRPTSPSQGDLLLESRRRGHPRHRAASTARCAAVRPLPEGLRAARPVEVHELFSRAARARRRRRYPLDAEGWLDPEQMVRDARRPRAAVLAACTARTARASAASAAATGTSASAPAITRRSTRAGPGSSSCSRSSRTRSEPRPRKEGTDGRPEEEAEQGARAPSARRTGRARRPPYAECPQCHQPKLPHRVCGNCGYYAGRQAVEVE